MELTVKEKILCAVFGTITTTAFMGAILYAGMYAICVVIKG